MGSLPQQAGPLQRAASLDGRHGPRRNHGRRHFHQVPQDLLPVPLAAIWEVLGSRQPTRPAPFIKFTELWLPFTDGAR